MTRLSRKRSLALLIATATATVGCGGATDDLRPDAGPRPDAGVGTPDGGALDAGPQLPACEGGSISYPGPLVDPAGEEGNPGQAGHFLRIGGTLNSDPVPDTLIIGAIYSIGVETGTFNQFPDNPRWIVSLCTDFDIDRLPPARPCTTDLEIVSGVLEVTSVTGRISGSLVDARLVDDPETPSCESRLPQIDFDEPIECLRDDPACLN